MSDLQARLQELIQRETTRAAIEEWSKAQPGRNVPLYNYRGDHVELVVRTALYLADEEGADKTVVALAAWLHDVAKPGLGGTDNHGEQDAELAERILSEAGVDPSLIERVKSAIRNHVGLTRQEPLPVLEDQVVWEADKLVKLGVVGVLHYVLNGLLIRPGMTLTDIAQRLSEFLSLAEDIAASMSTATARRLAQERLEVLRKLSAALARELFIAGDE